MQKIIKTFTLIFFSIIILRLIFLMIIKNDYFNNLMMQKTNVIINGTSAPRGRILDRYGNILVDNKGVKTIVYNKVSGIKKIDELEIAKKLADLIDIDDKPNDLILREYFYEINKDLVDKRIGSNIIKKYKERKITSDEYLNYKYTLIEKDEIDSMSEENKEASVFYNLMKQGYSYMDKVIKLNCSDQEYILINESEIPGVRAELSWERVYNYDDTLREILGSVSNNGIPYEEKEYYLNLGYSLNDRVGISYLERQYEEYLKGEKAQYKINRDNTLTKIKEEIKGNDLVLGIDIELQQEVDKIMKEEISKAKKYESSKYYKGSYVIISDVNTGEIVAISGVGINENKFYDSTIDIITNSYTMGSSVKGASMSVGYMYDLIDGDKKVLDGCVKLQNKTEKCSWKKLGYLNDINALAYSSNYYQFMIAIKLTGENYKYNMALNNLDYAFNTYRNVFDSYGLGVKTGIDLPNEKIGIKGKTISDDLLLNLSIGQYDTYTPIEMTQYINTIATGNRTKLSLMNKIVSNKGDILLENKNDILNKLDIELNDLDRIREGFKTVSKYGTGASYVNHKYKAAGKTGTSESFLDSNMDGIADTKTTTKVFVMYAPYDKPKYSLVVVSPHIGYENSSSDYIYPVNLYITKKITNILFENYSV